jgi:hypothetical protein
MVDPSDDTRRTRDRKRSPEPLGSLPDASVFPLASSGPRPSPAQRPESTAVPASAPVSHNVVFASLVASDADIVGFVAYGLYKHNKREWFAAFEAEHGRAPVAAEVRSYIVGESTHRKLATYRHLAEETLAIRDADLFRTQVPVPNEVHNADRAERLPPPRAPAPTRYHPRSRRGGSAAPVVLFLLVLGLMALGIVWLGQNGVLTFSRT